MRALVNRRGARTISLALAAGLLAFEAVLGLSAGAIGIPGLILFDIGGQDRESTPGGETVISKAEKNADEAQPAAPVQPASPRPTASLQSAAPSGEPNLAGLADIPLDPPVKSQPKPDAANQEPPPKAFSPDAKGREELPWDAVKPFPLTSDEPSPTTPAEVTASGAMAEASAQAHEAAPLPLPAAAEVEGWVKAKATEIKGEDRGRPLYDFEFWLEAPAEIKQRLLAVAYDFNTPAVMPQSQVSREQNTGFRIRVGGLACADKVTVTLKFKDGQSQQVAVDGCRLLG
ncbi:hypothetical protein [Methyloceanibacter sp.]|uniref:hypothetical protein n=1 Tax=Methyloceanibacter sp. TaxID=1965321 RepID=UPI002D4C19C2|nr:hypothetical protein [Methyloceanibacter sp.]HZP09465.1 hypothetical protein [Methyloceanibacter sp.]